MNPYREARRLARKMMAEGLYGQELTEGLRPVLPALDLAEKTRLAAAINREYMILGQAAHDPNMYANCRVAATAKKASPDAHLKLVTYRTPLCASCGHNRRNNCALMGGRIVAGPDDIPEVVVQRTAQILNSDQTLPERTIHRVASASASPADRLAELHKSRHQGQAPDAREMVAAQANSRRIAAMLDPGEAFEVAPKEITGPRRERNSEDYGIQAADITSDRVGSTRASRWASVLEPLDMEVELPPDRVHQVSPEAEVEPYTASMTIPEQEFHENPDLDEDNAIQAQEALHKLAKKASRFLASGTMTTRAATHLLQRMDAMEIHGAQHSKRTAAIRNQLDALSGGLQL